MKRYLVPLLALAALALPAGAQAKVVELGASAGPGTASCPTDPCAAITRTTAYQGRAGRARNPFRVPRAGMIVAFTVTLSKPNSTQLAFFNGNFGGPPQVRLSILRKGKRRKTRLDHRLMAQSRRYRLDHYFGSSPTFALSRPLRVRRGYIVALTTPTWAPLLAEGMRSSWWRTSRPRKTCADKSQQAAQQATGSVKQFGCTYFHERLLYTATYVPDPRPTDKKAK